MTLDSDDQSRLPLRILINSLACSASTSLLVQPALAFDYKRDIMPIFEEKCFSCHSEAEKVKGGLRLDDPKHLHSRFSKNDLVIPGDWDASYLFVAVSRPPGAKDAMPPKTKPGDGKSLSPEEVMKVARWIYEGARIEGERGERGSQDDKPEDFLKFRDGVLVKDIFDEVPPEGVEGSGVSEISKASRPQAWINVEGKKITATYCGIDCDQVALLLENGKTVKYPIRKLSEKSRAVLKELAAAGEEGD